MESFVITLVLVLVFWIASKNSKKKKTSTPDTNITYSYNTYKPDPSEWSIKNERREQFVQLYKDKNWTEMVAGFDGYDFHQHYNAYSDYQAMGMAWFHLGNYEKAEENFNIAVAAGNVYEAAKSNMNLAILYKEQGKWEKTLEWVQKSDPSQLRSQKIWGDFYRAMRVGAEAFFNLGLLDEGINFLKTAPTSARIIDHDLADIFEWLGRFYELNGDYLKSLKSYQKVVTVRYDKEINAKILELNQLVYEAEKERDDKKAKRESKKKGRVIDDFE